MRGMWRRRASWRPAIRFSELPLVEIATATSWARPSGISCRANALSKPTSLPTAVTVATSSVRQTPGYRLAEAGSLAGGGPRRDFVGQAARGPAAGERVAGEILRVGRGAAIAAG